MTEKLIGQRMTSQRRLLLDIIRNADEHLDADDIFRLAKEKDARISLSTVYRNLNLLKDSGLVVERHLGEEHHHYEINAGPDHHHSVCTECGEVFEFESQFTEKMKLEVEKASGFQVTQIEVDILGHCPKCQQDETVSKRISVAQMKAGQVGKVVHMSSGQGMQRIESMGLRPGKRITKVSGMFGRGPVTIQIGRSQLAIGFGMAKKILVEVSDK